MLYGANEVELGKQWANNKLLTSLSEKQEFLGCIRRDKFITVLIQTKKQYCSWRISWSFSSWY